MNQAQIDAAVAELVTIRDMLRYATSQFNQAQLFFGHGTDNAWDEAVAIIFPTLNLPIDSPPDIVNAALTRQERSQIMALIAKRINEHIPAAYLTNQAWFAGLSFYVDQRVIIPRSPTAELIERHFAPWIEDTNVHRIMDLCTGSGCIAIACAWQFPDAIVDAVDISKDALEVAAINRDKYQMQEQVNLIQSDLFTNISGEYDVIISNPPYVDATDMASLPAEFQHEPKLALEAGDDGLQCVDRILQSAAKYLTPHGILIVEVGNSADALLARYPDLPFTWLEFTRGDSEVFLLTKEQLEHVR